VSKNKRNKPRTAPLVTPLQWLRWADQDYLAARAILLNGFVLQGATIANTAIEKYLKTLLAVRKAKFGFTHDIAALYLSLKASGTAPPLSMDFLSLLGKAYQLRYPDSVEPGFNLSLPLNKILVEVDFTVHALRSGLHFQSADGRPIYTTLDNLGQHESTLTDRNVAFGNYSRQKAFAAASPVYEMRVLPGGNIIEANYITSSVTDDAIFNGEALLPQSGSQVASAAQISS